MVVFRVASGVKRHFMTRLIEWALAVDLCGFAVLLLAPSATFPTSHSYDLMATWATEATWGAVFLIIASLRLIALILNGTFAVFARYSPLARAIGAAMGSIVWFVLAESFLRANPAGTGWFNYAVWTVVDLTLAIHIAGEAGTAWKAQRHGGA